MGLILFEIKGLGIHRRGLGCPLDTLKEEPLGHSAERLVGILAGAFSGATLGARLAASLADAGLPSAFAQPVGVGSVVVAITYLSLIVGELVPKQIALRAPEQVAARVAPMMRFIARVAAPLIWVLDRSGKLVLALLCQSGARSRGVSDEEVHLIIAETESSGAMNRAESQMIAGVMRWPTGRRVD